MSEGVIITIEVVVRPEMVEQLVTAIPIALKYAQQAEGFRSARAVRHRDESNRFLFIEHWDSEEHFEAYQTWRGDRPDLPANDRAILSYLYDAWPSTIATAPVPGEGFPSIPGHAGAAYGQSIHSPGS